MDDLSTQVMEAFNKAASGSKAGLKVNFRNRFKAIYKGKRLLAVQLDGFSHTLFYDSGTRDSQVVCETYTGCAPEIKQGRAAQLFFHGIGHACYQNNAKEIIYILPEDR